MTTPRDTTRLDKWLWQARFFKTRTLSAKQISGGHVRLNGEKTSKPATAVGAGDVLTFPQGRQIRVIEIALCGIRRGPAPEAQTLYIDRTPVQDAPQPRAPGHDGKGRPTKKTRRLLDLSRRPPLE